MKRVSLLACCVVMSGCLHAAPVEVKKEGPAAAAQQAKPELSAALVEQTIIRGKTTTKEIVATFGPPNSIVKNTHLPSKEMLAKVKGPLPPIARTVEFWNYWTAPPSQDIERSAATDTPIGVFKVMIFIDENGVAVDYVSETSKVNFTQPGS